MITKPSSGGIVDRVRPHIGYAAFCRAVPGCGWSAVVGNLREGLGKVADVVDIWGAPSSQGAACDAVLAMDCVSCVPEPYFIYICPERAKMAPVDPAVYQRAAGLFAENGHVARWLAESAGIPRDKIHVVPPAVVARQAPLRIPPSYLREAPRRKLLLCVDECTGQGVSPKSAWLVFDALDILRREHDSQIRLTISGLPNWPAGDSRPEGVSLRDAPSAAETLALFDSHDLLVVPPGPGSHGVPEALSRGVPCVGACASEMSKAITPGITGAIIEDGDARELAAAIASVLADDAIYRRCFERAPAMAAYFSWERVARQVAHVISRELALAFHGDLAAERRA